MKRILSILMAPVAALASGTATWEMNTYQDFLRGRFNGVSLGRDGRLALAPRLDTLFSSDQPAIWSLALAPDGVLYAGTGHRGRVFRIEKDGKSSLYWTAEQPEVFAVAVDPRGAVYAGASPEGKVYRLEKGKASEYFSPKARYIWALAFASDGTLYVGTGDQGRIYRVTGPGQGELYYDTGQSHVTALAFDRQGRLLAGTEPNGILYRVTARDKAFVLYDANLPEIRSVVATPDGSVYLAALGGSLAGRGGMPASTTPVTPGAPGVSVSATSVTVEAQAGLDVKPKADTQRPQTATPQVTTQVTPMVDLSGVEKSAVYKISPDHTVETLWSSKEENVYDLLASGTRLIFATDGKGRIYRIGEDRKVTLVVETGENETTRLLETGGGLLAASGSAGRIYRLGETAAGGNYESPVHDAGSVARWGRLSWRAEVPDGARLVFRTRTGNSARPDRTWSEWSAPLSDAAAALVPSPNARYVQWKAEFGGSGAAAQLDSVALAYLPQNNPPVVKSISATTQWVAAAPAKAAAPSSTAAYSITVTDTGEAGASSASGTPTQTPARAGSQQIQLAWQAEDADGDRLVYALQFRGEDEREWKMLKSNTQETSFTLDADAFADGRYLFRVVASDRLANPPSAAREAELVSAPVLLDNTPPVVSIGAPRRTDARVELEVEATDATSPLRRAEYSLDAGGWVPMAAADGVVDSRRERFWVRVENVPPGEHVIVARAFDSAGNVGLAKVVVR